MSLFKWSTPERRSADRILPIIPNEIYFHVFDHIAQPTGPLAPDELRLFINLSRVCRLFADFCLPRIFEFLEFSGSVFRDDTPTALRNDTVYKTSRGGTLCTQIAAKQPLALALAKTVRVCHFTEWKLNRTGSWAVRLFAQKYMAGMSHMSNIRELKFSHSDVDTDHWNTIAMLESLDELSFNCCNFLRGPGVEPNEWAKVKPSRLRVTTCTGNRQPAAAIDACHVRTLVTDYEFFEQVDWLSQSALTVLHLSLWEFGPPSDSSTGKIRFLFSGCYIERLRAALMQVPKTLEALEVEIRSHLVENLKRTFEELAWKNLPLLRSLTLWVDSVGDNIVSLVLEGIGLLTNVESFTLKNYTDRRVFNLVDGVWLQGS